MKALKLLVALLVIFLALPAFAQNNPEAWENQLKEAENGDSFSQFIVGNVYLEGLWGVPKDAAKAAQWYKKAAEQGNHGAIKQLIRMYREGDGLPQDSAKAAYWDKKLVELEKAGFHELLKKAESGDADAQYKLGGLYYEGYNKGFNVPQDFTKAMYWFQKAANQGDAYAQYAVGLLYSAGQGISQDFFKAAIWFKKAAEQGHDGAKLRLGLLHMTGTGIILDKQKGCGLVRSYLEEKERQAATLMPFSDALGFEIFDSEHRTVVEAYNTLCTK